MSLIPLFRAHHQLFVSVEVNIDVKRNLLVRHSNPRCGEPSLVLTGGLRLQTEVLEVVDTLGVHQVYRLEVVHGSPSVVVTESALQSDVVVFHAAADEIVLEKIYKKPKSSSLYPQHKYQLPSSQSRSEFKGWPLYLYFMSKTTFLPYQEFYLCGNWPYCILICFFCES